MAGTKAPVGLPITVEGGDRATVELEKISKSVKNLDKNYSTLLGRIRGGLQWHLVYNGIRLIERSIHAAATAIPDLIARGQRWASVVDDISDATGMNARQSSELAAVQLMLGGSTESLGKAMVQLSRNARLHEGTLKEMGVATRDAHGRFLGIYQILQNLRDAYASTSDGATRFGRAYQVLGRGTREVTDLLSLNAGQYAMLADQAQRAGLVMNETMARNAETLRRTQGILDATITGLGTQILGGVAPVLTALVNGISQAIQSNMSNIVRFAVQVVNTIAGLIGGLFGIDFNLISLAGQMDVVGKSGANAAGGLSRFGKGAKDAASGASAASSAIQRQIDAIDRQIKALDRQEKREDARREHAKLMTDIREARAELGEIRSQSIFAAGMSDAEAELARQAQAAHVQEGIKKLRDAEDALRKWRRDQERDRLREQLQMQRDALQDQLAAQRSANASMIAAAGTTGIRMGKGLTSGIKPLTKEMKDAQASLLELARESLATGREWSSNIKDFLFGPETYPGRNQLGQPGGTPVRQGGVAGVVQSIATLGGFLSDNTFAIKTLIAAIAGWKVATVAKDVALAIRTALGVVPGGAVGVATATAGLIAQEIINQQDRRDGPAFDLFKWMNDQVGRDYNADLNRADAKHPGRGTLEWLMDLGDTIRMWQSKIGTARDNMLRDPGEKRFAWRFGGPYLDETGAMGLTGGRRIRKGDPLYDAAIAWAIEQGIIEPARPTYSRPTSVTGFLKSLLGADSRGAGAGKPANWEPLYGTPSSDAYPPGLGFNRAGLVGVDALVVALDQTQRDYLASGSPVVNQLAAIDSSIQSLVAVLRPGGGGDTDPPPPNTGDSLATRVTKLAARVTVNEAVDKAQGKRLDKLAARSTAIETVNKVQALVLSGLDKVNDKQDTRIKAQGQLLNTHEARLDRLDGGGSGPRARAARTAAAPAFNLTIKLDRAGTRELLSGRSVTSTTRAVPGV